MLMPTQLATKIGRLVASSGFLTIGQLSQRDDMRPYFKGATFVLAARNLLLWGPISWALAEALVHAQRAGWVTIIPHQLDRFLAIGDGTGRLPPFPHAARVRGYARLRWLPVVLVPGPKPVP